MNVFCMVLVDYFMIIEVDGLIDYFFLLNYFGINLIKRFFKFNVNLK